jgi:predicted DNA-binding ribbon-helix-helix protein
MIKAEMKKLSMTISGHRTSIALEDEFIAALKAIARKHGAPVSEIVRGIDAQINESGAGGRHGARTARANLSSAVRVYILRQLMPK